uniref:Uncharacterized protein n=1 Tax=viral metagenome TaxID=1070528 RepID=A0A6M3M979_9ZZZZ
MREGGSIIIQDFEDVWGNKNTLGLGEHAVRTHAAPMMFDKRGNVLRWLDFESPASSAYYFVTGIAGTSYARRSIDYSLTGDFSAKLYSSEAGSYPYIGSSTNDFSLNCIGLQCTFSFNDTRGRILLHIVYYNGTEEKKAVLEYIFLTGLIRIYVQPSYVTVGTVLKQPSYYNFSTIKLIVDLKTLYFKEVLIGGNSFDISEYPLSSNALVSHKRLDFHCKLDGKYGPTTMYIDNFILTENE